MRKKYSFFLTIILCLLIAYTVILSLKVSHLEQENTSLKNHTTNTQNSITNVDDLLTEEFPDKMIIKVEIGATITEIEELGKKLAQLDNIKQVKFLSKQQIYSLITDTSKNFTQNDEPLFDIYLLELEQPANFDSTEKQIKKFEHITAIKHTFDS